MRGEWGPAWHVWEFVEEPSARLGRDSFCGFPLEGARTGLCAVGRTAGRKVGVRGVLVRVQEGSPVRTLVSASCLRSAPCLLENPADGP